MNQKLRHLLKKLPPSIQNHDDFIDFLAELNTLLPQTNQEGNKIAKVSRYDLWFDRLVHAAERADMFKHKVGVINLQLTVNQESLESDDELIDELLERIKTNLNPTDSIFHREKFNFYLLIECFQSHDEISELAEGLIATFQETFFINELAYSWTSHMGISIFPTDSRWLETLVRFSEEACKLAANTENNNYIFHSSALERLSSFQASQESALRQGFINEEFCLHYLPKFEAASKKIAGVEALIRWQHPELGLTESQHFIEHIERSGLLIPIGEWAIEKAFAQLREWHDAGFEHLTLSINLAQSQLEDENIVPFLQDLLHKHQIEGQYIEIDISEAAFSDQEKVIEQLMGIKALNIQFAWDDFGIGLCSLRALLELPFNSIKLDNELIEKLQHSQQAIHLARSIINLAHDINVQVIAEGVANKAVYDCLCDYQCDYVQGNFLCKAMAAEAITTLLLSHKTKDKASGSA